MVLLINVVTICSSALDAVEQAHALCLLTEWDEFMAADFHHVKERMATPPFIFDGRLILPHQQLIELGFEVKCIGKALK